MKKIILLIIAGVPLLLFMASCNNQPAPLSGEDSLRIHNQVDENRRHSMPPMTSRYLKARYVDSCQAEFKRRFKNSTLTKCPPTFAVSFAQDGTDPVGQGISLDHWYRQITTNPPYPTETLTHMTIIPGVYVDPKGFGLNPDVEKYLYGKRKVAGITDSVKVIGSISFFLRAEKKMSVSGVVTAKGLSGVDDFNLGDLQP